MEQENIQYTGITQATPDLNCPDGDLSISHNIINHNGAMRPIILPEAEFALKSGETLLYVHTTSNYKNFIYLVGDSIKAFTVSEEVRKDYSVSYSLSSEEELNKIESVGNTLIVFSTLKIEYILWDEKEYKLLGNTIPEVAVSFGLIGNPKLYSELIGKNNEYVELRVSFDSISEDKIYNEFTEENKTKITNQVLPVVNKFIKEISVDKGRFIYPFFVRYGLRMFDGSLIYHSSPILMIPATNTNPIVTWGRYTGRGSYSSAGLDIFAVACDLDYQIASDISALKQWKDIVKSIDIFISEPIYTYNQNGKCESFFDTKNFDVFFIGKWDGTELIRHQHNKLLEKYYQKWNLIDVFRASYHSKYSDALSLPEISKDEVNNKIRECSNFYYLSSLNIESLESSDTRKKIEIGEESLKNIALKERMTDDYQTHDRLISGYSFVYNGRLNIANIKKELFNGYDSAAICTYSNGRVSYSQKIETENSFSEHFEDDVEIGKCDVSNRICKTEISENGKVIVVENTCNIKFANFGYYLFYPNSKAVKMEVSHSTSGWIVNNGIHLQEHKGLNGCYYFSNFEELSSETTVSSKTPDRTIQLPNKLYTSEVGNPFLFPLEGINTIGLGKILGMTSTTRALSQGQFGQFPLLVFATDGIWAMEVSPNGLYSVKQPISRDICSNPKSITQIDGAVIFISDKGAMIIDADQVNTFSAELDGPTFSPASVIQFDVIAEKEGLTKELNSQVSVKDFLMNCQIAYDYPNSRLLFINANKPYAYVYSLQSHSWATVTSSFTHVVTDYPHTYLQGNNRQIVNISSKIDYESASRIKSIMLSRPIKLGDDMLKTVNQVINRGNFEVDKINVALFASTDGITYFPIGSAIGPRISGLCGSPYRYFRIAVISNFSAKESLSTTSVYYTPKWRNKPR